MPLWLGLLFVFVAGCYIKLIGGVVEVPVLLGVPVAALVLVGLIAVGSFIFSSKN